MIEEHINFLNKLLKTRKNKKLLKKNICIVAGGTGGHIIPALSVANNLIKNDYKVVFITDKRFDNYAKYMDLSEIDNDNFHLYYFNFKNSDNFLITLLSKIVVFTNIFRLIGLLTKHQISITIGFGGIITVPAIIASRILGKYSIVHEQNSYAGLANRFLGFFSNLILISFKKINGFSKILNKKIYYSGLPMRSEICNLYYKNTSKIINYEAFFKIYDDFVITVCGGSQGAKSINRLFTDCISELSYQIRRKIKLYHQVGEKENIEEIEKIYSENSINFVVRPFFNNMLEIISKSHLIISRAGASAVLEIAAIGTPSILIPLPSAKNNHQLLNAKQIYDTGGCILFEEKFANGKKLAALITNLFESDSKLGKISSLVKKYGDPYGSERILDIIETIVEKKISNHFYNYYRKNNDNNFLVNSIGVS